MGEDAELLRIPHQLEHFGKVTPHQVVRVEPIEQRSVHELEGTVALDRMQAAQHPVEGSRRQRRRHAGREPVWFPRFDTGQDPQFRKGLATAGHVGRVAGDVQGLHVRSVPHL